MGVKTALAAVVPTNTSVNNAEVIGFSVNDNLTLAKQKCDELAALLLVLKNEVFTPASDSTAATAMTTQITALS